MNTNRILVAGVVGGIVYFFLGWIIYGMLLMDFMSSHGQGASYMRADGDMVWWALLLGNICGGLLLAMIFGRWGSISTWQTGAAAGAVIGLLMGASFDLTMYGTSTLMDMTGTVVDILVYGVMGAVGGAVVAWVLGYKK